MKEYKYDSDKDRIVAEEDLKPEPYGSVVSVDWETHKMEDD